MTQGPWAKVGTVKGFCWRTVVTLGLPARKVFNIFILVTDVTKQATAVDLPSGGLLFQAGVLFSTKNAKVCLIVPLAIGHEFTHFLAYTLQA